MDDSQGMKEFLPDSQLINKIRTGDQGAEELFFHKYWRALTVVCLRTGLVEADAEEVVNDVFLTALEKARDGTLGPNAGPWLQKVARNRALDRHRRNQSSHELEVVPLDEARTASGQQEEQTENPGVKFIVRRALQSLEKEEDEWTGPKVGASDLDILKWIAHGVTNAELANYLNTSENAARQRRFRALNRLREVLKFTDKELIKSSTYAMFVFTVFSILGNAGL